jgi:hypothetical protein
VGPTRQQVREKERGGTLALGRAWVGSGAGRGGDGGLGSRGRLDRFVFSFFSNPF